MQKIGIDGELYTSGLNVIEKGFMQSLPAAYEDNESDIPSLVAMLETLKKINTAMDSYHAFLSADVAKFRQIGEIIQTTDAELAASMGGGT